MAQAQWQDPSWQRQQQREQLRRQREWEREQRRRPRHWCDELAFDSRCGEESRGRVLLHRRRVGRRRRTSAHQPEILGAGKLVNSPG